MPERKVRPITELGRARLAKEQALAGLRLMQLRERQKEWDRVVDHSERCAREFNQVEPENVMKFELVHPGPTNYNFGMGDLLVTFAQSHQIAIRGDPLVWHKQLPSWLTSGGFSPSELSSILEDHIHRVVGHYAGKVYAWDVVNEAFNDDGSLVNSIWSNSPGI